KTLLPGMARASQPLQLRKRPPGEGEVAQTVPAGASLQLQARQANGEGSWWFAEYDGALGWVPERSLTQ
ncbi:MAG: hypothetical protein ACREUF_14510, partial [Solimonas sp.]